MDASRTVLVLGGGVGGVVTARTVRELLPRRHRVILVDRAPNHLFAPSLLWLAVGKREGQDIQRPLEGLQRKGIEVRLGEVTAIDPEARAVTVDGVVLSADFIVISLGAELSPETVPGLSEAGHNLYTLAGAQGVWGALRAMRSGRVVVLTAAPMYKCPAAPYEAALLMDGFLREQGLREGVSVEVYAAEAKPMAVAGSAMSDAVRGLLDSHDVPYHPGQQVKSVDVQAKKLVFTDGTDAAYDLLVYVPPHRAPGVVRESVLAGETGWIPVDRHTLATRFAGVYAIGDVVTIPLALGKPLPKAGVFAHGQAQVVAKNIAAAILGGPPTQRFDGHGTCFVEVGGGKAGYGGGDFYAEPLPTVSVHAPARRWHFGKVLFEKSWLHTKL